jgi:lysophospholipase L1-like esterase
VDGAPVARLPLMEGRHRYALLEGMEKGFSHEVSVSRDTQPCDSDAAPLLLTAVYTDGVPVAPAERPALIEFIGDSLTVGEGCAGPIGAMEWRMAWISNCYAYPTLVSERLNAEKRVIALGGWGVYRSWDGRPECTIGRIYDRLCAVVPGGDISYDFSAARQPDAVVINLGTNDASALNTLAAVDRELAEAEVTQSAVALVRQVRRQAPKAVILWAYGLCGNPLKDALMKAVEQMQAEGDENVVWMALDDCGVAVGSRSHPGREAHQHTAELIAGELLRIGLSAGREKLGQKN